MKIHYLLLAASLITAEAVAHDDDLFQDPEKRQKAKFLREREHARESWMENEAEYDRETAPHEVDDPDYFEKSHPLEEEPLDESLLR